MRAAADVAHQLEIGGLVPSEADRLTQAWVELLGRYQFDWFVTFTFRESVHPENADKLFARWIRDLNQYLHGKRRSAFSHNQVFWVRAIEKQKRGVIHFHALIGDTRSIAEQIGFGKDAADKACLLYWTERWFDQAGICRIDEIRENTDEVVHRYVAKYIAKDGEIDVSENLKDYVRAQRGFLGR